MSRLERWTKVEGKEARVMDVDGLVSVDEALGEEVEEQQEGEQEGPGG